MFLGINTFDYPNILERTYEKFGLNINQHNFPNTLIFDEEGVLYKTSHSGFLYNEEFADSIKQNKKEIAFYEHSMLPYNETFEFNPRNREVEFSTIFQSSFFAISHSRLGRKQFTGKRVLNVFTAIKNKNSLLFTLCGVYHNNKGGGGKKTLGLHSVGAYGQILKEKNFTSEKYVDAFFDGWSRQGLVNICYYGTKKKSHSYNVICNIKTLEELKLGVNNEKFSNIYNFYTISHKDNLLFFQTHKDEKKKKLKVAKLVEKKGKKILKYVKTIDFPKAPFFKKGTDKPIEFFEFLDSISGTALFQNKAYIISNREDDDIWNGGKHALVDLDTGKVVLSVLKDDKGDYPLILKEPYESFPGTQINTFTSPLAKENPDWTASSYPKEFAWIVMRRNSNRTTLVDGEGNFPYWMKELEGKDIATASLISTKKGNYSEKNNYNNTIPSPNTQLIVTIDYSHKSYNVLKYYRQDNYKKPLFESYAQKTSFPGNHWLLLEGENGEVINSVFGGQAYLYHIEPNYNQTSEENYSSSETLLKNSSDSDYVFNAKKILSYGINEENIKALENLKFSLIYLLNENKPLTFRKYYFLRQNFETGEDKHGRIFGYLPVDAFSGEEREKIENNKPFIFGTEKYNGVLSQWYLTMYDINKQSYIIPSSELFKKPIKFLRK